MGKKRFQGWKSDEQDKPADWKKLETLIHIDLSLVYPDYYTRSLNFPVAIPKGKVDRLRRRHRRKKVDCIYADKGMVAKILARNEPVSLDPIQVTILPPGKVYNPVTQEFIRGSDYLRGIFENDYFSYLFASLVTFYRHYDIASYDASWQNEKYGRDNETYQRSRSHRDFRATINNRAKRHLIRAIMRDRNITLFGAIALVKSVGNLRNTDEETWGFAEDCLRKLNNRRTFHPVK